MENNQNIQNHKMDILELVAELKRRDIQLRITDCGRLGYSVPKHTISLEMRDAVKRYKYALIDMLIGQAAMKGELKLRETFFS